MSDVRRQLREPDTGRFDFDGDFARVCTCGHPLGLHTLGGWECLAHDAHNIDAARWPAPLPACDCERFRPTRRRA